MFNKETNLYEGYIYKVENLISHKLYIGQTRRNIHTRFTEHIRNATKDKMPYPCAFYFSIRKYGKENFQISQIEKIANETKAGLQVRLNELQIYYIAKYNTLIPNGYNMTAGGENTSVNGLKPVIAYYTDGRFFGEYPCINDAAEALGIKPSGIASCCTGRNKSAYGLVWRHKGDSFDKYETSNIRPMDCLVGYHFVHKKIKQYAPQGNLLEIYKSAAEAARKINKDVAPILNCCRGKVTSAYGYIWRYEDNPFDKYDTEHICSSRVICQYTINGVLVKKYASMTEASKSIFGGTKDVTGKICLVCKGRRKRAYGYVWRYDGDSFNKYDSYVSENHGKRIRKFSLSGEELKVYDSFKEAAEDFPDSPNAASAISLCCNGKQNTAYGYVWRYYSDSFGKYSLKNKSTKAVNQYLLSGEYVETFEKIQDICDYFGKNIRASIQRCCNKRQEKYKNWKFYYADDPDQPDKSKIIKD